MVEAGKRGGQALGASGGTPGKHRQRTTSPTNMEDDDDTSNTDLKNMLTKMMGKLDSLGTKVDASMLLAQEARADAASAKQANYETRETVAALESDMKQVKAEVQVLNTTHRFQWLLLGHLRHPKQ